VLGEQLEQEQLEVVVELVLVLRGILAAEELVVYVGGLAAGEIFAVEGIVVAAGGTVAVAEEIVAAEEIAVEEIVFAVEETVAVVEEIVAVVEDAGLALPGVGDL